MNLFWRQIKFVEDFEKNLFLQLEKTIQQNEHVLKNYIVEKQLYNKGVDGNNKKLKGYTRTTIRLKKRKGQPTNRTTLRDKNEFHPSIHINAYADRFEVVSNVTHDKFIIKKYGKDVLKVSNENFREFLNRYFVPNLKNYVNNKLAK